MNHRSRQQILKETNQATTPANRQPNALSQRRFQGRSTANWFAYWLVGGSMLAMVGVLVDLRSLVQPARSPDVCEETLQPQSVLSRQQLSQFLSIPERASKSQVQQVVQQPYCRLSSLNRAGVIAEREAYPLAFDPNTWFVILYEGEEYAGYDFSFNH